ncbi:MAG: thioredoxin family protein, partial [Polyangiaceae bacterium]|nr:thioredoxin family protein [Polyangiaceae bacterium]
AESLPFIADDYSGALAQARRRGVPLFVDAWAPWCHTCLSLRAYVFPDPALRRFAARFIWLAIDTERAENAALVERLRVRELPTLFVIDPASETPSVAWVGSLTAPELAKLLDEALAAADRGSAQADDALRKGHRLGAAGRNDAAIEAYRSALATAPAGWASRAETIDALVTRLRQAGRLEECAHDAAGAVGSMPAGTARADVLRSGIECGRQGDEPWLEALTAFGERVAFDPREPILADDRSDLFDYVASGWTRLGRPDDAHRVAAEWARFLEAEAAHAPSPAARAVFDAHRLAAYLALGTPERALPMLDQSARDFPGDYNPPARMGRALIALGRPGDAIVALERAIALAYGPRKLNLWSTQADAYIARGDAPGARRALERAIAFSREVPLSEGYGKLRAELEGRLEGLLDAGAKSDARDSP